MKLIMYVPCTMNYINTKFEANPCISLRLVGWLYLMSHRQRGHLETAPPFIVPCEEHEAQYLHRSHQESNPGRCMAVHYTTAAPRQLPPRFKRSQKCDITYIVTYSNAL